MPLCCIAAIGNNRQTLQLLSAVRGTCRFNHRCFIILPPRPERRNTLWLFCCQSGIAVVDALLHGSSAAFYPAPCSNSLALCSHLQLIMAGAHGLYGKALCCPALVTACSRLCELGEANCAHMQIQMRINDPYEPSLLPVYYCTRAHTFICLTYYSD